MTMFCARLKEVMQMKKKFIQVYGEQALIKDHSTVISMKELHEKQVREFRNRGNSQ